VVAEAVPFLDRDENASVAIARTCVDGTSAAIIEPIGCLLLLLEDFSVIAESCHSIAWVAQLRLGFE